MKRILVLLVAVVGLSALSSCGSSPYKKRKGCRGNGSWYGNRNLGAIQQPTTTPQHYVMTTEETADL